MHSIHRTATHCNALYIFHPTYCWCRGVPIYPRNATQRHALAHARLGAIETEPHWQGDPGWNTDQSIVQKSKYAVAAKLQGMFSFRIDNDHGPWPVHPSRCECEYERGSFIAPLHPTTALSRGPISGRRCTSCAAQSVSSRCGSSTLPFSGF